MTGNAVRKTKEEVRRPVPFRLLKTKDGGADGSVRRAPRRISLGYVDYSLLLTVFFLAIFGLIMLFSTSSYEGGLKFGDPAFFVKRQLAATLFGVVLMFALSIAPDYRMLQHLAVPAYLFSAGLILLVLSPLGYEANGARRWLKIGSMSVQPAEVAKIAMIVFLASLVLSMKGKIVTWKGFAFFLGSALPVALLIYKVTKNLSSACIVMGIAVIMLFVATPGYKRFAAMAAAGSAAVFGIVYYILHYADPSDSMRFARVLAWSDLESYSSGTGYQTLQALYAIGSGGIFGKGLGESIQKTGFIPEAQNDMIFSIICEELGLFGGLCVIIMFFLLLWRLMIIANNAPDLFGSLLTVGVMGHIAIQVILNIAVVTNLVPNTGITLPFISYGGSAVVMQLAEIGLVMNVARRIKT
ncbi:MAG: FtsW/RodA/SpoVE family cell cycle protein [Lachnospiraceae bacterium]|nr:FtsW/RodA/SpoVE family cell cycle protein [Lachnospiraceae bacterium]